MTKPLIQRLPLAPDTSFVARTYRTPDFEVPWHQHMECELILFTEGDGLSFVGNYVGEFETGDVFFLGANLPHTFQKKEKNMVVSAVVVQFREDFWGEEFMSLPENGEIREFFAFAVQGMKLKGQSRLELQPLIRRLEFLSGFHRIMQLGHCLQILLQSDEYDILSTQDIKSLNRRDKERIEDIFRYTIDSFQGNVTLNDIAKVAGMSIPAFCSYFKKCTKKTYIQFLNEIRIGYASKLLADTNRTVLDVCYDSGFNTLANFNKQFLRIKGMAPSKFRIYFAHGSLSTS